MGGPVIMFILQWTYQHYWGNFVHNAGRTNSSDVLVVVMVMMVVMVGEGCYLIYLYGYGKELAAESLQFLLK